MQIFSQSYESLQYQIQNLSKPKRFDIKTIQTYNLFCDSQLYAIGRMIIRQQTLVELISTTLKLCYMTQPLLQTLYELESEGQNKQFYNLNLNPTDLQTGSSNRVWNVGLVLRVLHQNLFYRHMVKLKIQNTFITNDIVISLVNNRPTDLNRKVIIAALLSFVSKKMTMEQIRTTLMVFSLEEALVKLRPYGLHMEVAMLQKYMKKIQRITNANELKNFIHLAKQVEQQMPEKQNIQNSQANQKNSIQYVIGPDQFLFLATLSQKKSPDTNIFLIPQEKKKLGIDVLIQKKKNQSPFPTSGISNSNSHPVRSSQNQETTTNNQIQSNMISSKIFEENSNLIKNSTNLNENSLQNQNSGSIGQANKKVRGLSLYQKQSNIIKAAERQAQVYGDIKKYLSEHNNFRSTSNFARKNDDSSKRKLVRAKSAFLQEQMTKVNRPSSAIFKKSIQLLQQIKKKQNRIRKSSAYKTKFQTESSKKTEIEQSKQRSKAQIISHKKSAQWNNELVRKRSDSNKSSINSSTQIQAPKRISRFRTNSNNSKKVRTMSRDQIVGDNQIKVGYVNIDSWHKNISVAKSMALVERQEKGERNEDSSNMIMASLQSTLDEYRLNWGRQKYEGLYSLLSNQVKTNNKRTSIERFSKNNRNGRDSALVRKGQVKNMRKSSNLVLKRQRISKPNIYKNDIDQEVGNISAEIGPSPEDRQIFNSKGWGNTYLQRITGEPIQQNVYDPSYPTRSVIG